MSRTTRIVETEHTQLDVQGDIRLADFATSRRQRRGSRRRWLIGALAAELASHSGAAALDVPSLIEQATSSVSLVQWQQAHPDDPVALFSHRMDTRIRGWCARVTTSTTHETYRYTYFFPPPQDDEAALPTGHPTQVSAQCRLGMIQWERYDRTTQEADSAWTDVLSDLHTELGEPTKVARRARDQSRQARNMSMRGTGPRDTHTWWLREGLSLRAGRVDSSHSLLVAAAPWAAATHASARNTYERHFHRDPILRDYEPGIRAARLSGLPAGLADTLAALLVTNNNVLALRIDGRKAALIDQSHALLTEWLSRATGLDAPQRAAALLAADFLMNTKLLDSFGRKYEIPIMRRFQALGARFVYLGIPKSYRYKRNWLYEARDLDPGGPVDHLALIDQLERGFHDYACSGGPTPWQRVIDEGERLLLELAEDRDRARVHALVARAYGDILALEDGITEHYEPMAGIAQHGARYRAVEHYRQALALDRTTPLSREANREAWRLLAGLPPLALRYHCFYD